MIADLHLELSPGRLPRSRSLGPGGQHLSSLRLRRRFRARCGANVRTDGARVGEHVVGARGVWLRARAVSLLLFRRQDQAVEQTCQEGFLNSHGDGIDGDEVRKSIFCLYTLALLGIGAFPLVER